MVELTLEMAERALRAAQAKAKELGAPMSVAIVDEGGNLVLVAKGDGTGFLTTETSRGKAYAAAALRRPTKAMAEAFKESPAFWGSLVTLQPGRLLPSIGGVPIVRGGRVIGGIGCGGGTGEQDHLCAEAGAAALAS